MENYMRRKISVFFEITEYNGIKVLFDCECPMCLRMVARMRLIWEPRGFEFVPLQAEWVHRKLALPEEELLREMRVLMPDGRVLGGADAHALLWGHVWWLWPLWLLDKVPGGHWLINWVYERIAANRYRISHWLDCETVCNLKNLTSTSKRKENNT